MISIILPTYNRIKYLPEVLNSIFNQTHKDFEVIIIDDGSTDDTKNYIQEYIINNSNKIFYYFQNNHGAAAARNLGIQPAQTGHLDFCVISIPQKWLGYPACGL